MKKTKWFKILGTIVLGTALESGASYLKDNKNPDIKDLGKSLLIGAGFGLTYVFRSPIFQQEEDGQKTASK